MMQTIRLNQWFLLVMGTFCILTPNHIVKILPYLLGGNMAMIGVFSVGVWSRNMEKDTAATDFAYGLVLLIVGVSFVFQGEKSLLPMGITWAIIGIRKASQTLIQLIHAIDYREPCWFLTIDFCVRILLALLLLFDPYGKFTPHLRILGAELIVNNLQPAILSRDK